MKFTKMHGIGNDYVYVNCFEESVKNPAEVSKFVSNRHFGIGSDGLILISPSAIADFRMNIYNADGSQAEMCGNGIRCVAKYVYDYGLTDKTEISVETLAGIKYLRLQVENGKVASVEVNMGAPILEPKEIPVAVEESPVVNVPVEVKGKIYHMTCVSMGNPHAIIFMNNVKDLDIEAIGPYFENHTVFPKRTNTEFVEVLDRNTVNMRVWERGSDETLACGTGACATTVACILNDKTENEVTVHLLGGDLKIRWDREANQVYMTGPATVVFDGEITLPDGIA
ncbi:MAG: diaminopimelate epimerase [Anaerobutyricum soehngenii]|uniref:Diaminopimelate epimerase n=1 Tax=Anaerobutyricum soehngenii TaxID=105843 RepID=A0A6N7YK73_9FIRM|nr:diaminopimelate epimerase [Anaerobutyricum soehngenii]MCI7272017.1 diaminopimelate epimerase [Anaerobutyricum hallii]MDY5244481.1 diaminopimelate epimerase [Anaerobutyricum soehngenii]MSU83438.1 diaminopimelate epimerase [Anaerobutyricum soehngenii]